jgi:hypothetical protein
MIGDVLVVYGVCERCGSALTSEQQRRRARFCRPSCRPEASRVPRQRPAECTVFVDMAAERFEKGAVAYGDKSFSQEPGELVRQIDEEIVDICGWSFVLHTRVRRLVEAVEEPTSE